MNIKLENLIESYKKTDWQSLLREDLGIHNLKEIKPYLDFAKNFIDSVLKKSHKFSSYQQDSLKKLLKHFLALRMLIKSHEDTSRNQEMIDEIIFWKSYVLDNFQDLLVGLNTHLKNLIEDYKKTDWQSLLREDLGIHNLKKIKPYLDFVKNFIDSLLKNPHKLPENRQRALIKLLNEFLRWRKLIKNHTDTSRNQEMINSSINYKNYILDNFQDLSVVSNIQMEHDPEKILEKPEIEIKKYQSARKEMEQELKKFRQTQSQLAGQAIKAEAVQYGDFFKKEAEKKQKNIMDFWRSILDFLFSGRLDCLSLFKI